MFHWGKKKDSGSELESRDGSDLLMTGRAGLIDGTHVASNFGWRKVETLGLGDKVLTFDHGMQVVTDIQRETAMADPGGMPDECLPVRVPEGVLSNRAELWLMPDQGLLLELEDGGYDPFAVVPAWTLIGFRGITRAAPRGAVRTTVLSFASDEVVYAEGGVLLHCPHTAELLDGASDATGYRMLEPGAARLSLAALEKKGLEAAFFQDASDVARCA